MAEMVCGRTGYGRNVRGPNIRGRNVSGQNVLIPNHQKIEKEHMCDKMVKNCLFRCFVKIIV